MNFFNIFTGQRIQSQSWQDALKPGDCYVIENPGVGLMTEGGPNFYDLSDDLTVYGEILDAEGCEEGFFNVRAHSVECPEGELGIMCIADATRAIDRREFELAREAGWIVDHCDECRSPSNDLACVFNGGKEENFIQYICRECRRKRMLCEECGTPKSAPNFAYHVCAPVRRRKAGRQ